MCVRICASEWRFSCPLKTASWETVGKKKVGKDSGPSESKENRENRDRRGEREGSRGRGGPSKRGRGGSRSRPGEGVCASWHVCVCVKLCREAYILCKQLIFKDNIGDGSFTLRRTA